MIRFYRYSILTVVCLAVALVPFTVTSINLALPHIANELNLSAIALGWIITVFLLPYAIFQIPFGKIGDIYGRKKILLTGNVLFLVSTAGCALSQTGNMLLAFRFVQGLGSAMLFATSYAIISSVFPARGRGRAFGINTAVIYFALASGPFFGGIFTHYWGWRSIFYITISLAVLTLAGILVFLKGEWRDARDDHFDWQGSLIYAFGLSAIIYGCSLLPSISGFSLIVVGLAGFTAFVYYEKKQASPVFNINMFFENRVFRMSSFAALINYSATFAITFMLSLYLHYV
jgi:MFS family permease